MAKVLYLVFAAFLVATVILGGCDSDEPDPVTPNTGVVIVDITPDDLNPTWTVTRPWT